MKTTIVKGKGTNPSVAGIIKSLKVRPRVKITYITVGGEEALVDVTYSSKGTVTARAVFENFKGMTGMDRLPVTEVGKETDASWPLDDALRTNELVKIQFSKNFDGKPKEVANDIAAAVSADVVQTIGRTATVYRENPALRK